jgi:hypothetical protein
MGRLEIEDKGGMEKRRVNPRTLTFYRRGDCENREGQVMIFSNYERHINKSTGFFREKWRREEGFHRHNEQRKQITRRNRVGSTRTLSSIAQQLFHSARKRAAKSGGVVTITKAWILQRLLANVCEFTGLPFAFPADGKRVHNRAPSLDRIDSSNKNYSPENTRVVCIQVNLARGIWHDETSFPLLARMVEVMGKAQACERKNIVQAGFEPATFA